MGNPTSPSTPSITTSPASTTAASSSPLKRRFHGFARFYKSLKSPKRSNQTEATRTSFCEEEEESCFADDFKQGEIIIKGFKKKHRKRGGLGGSKSWSPRGAVSSSGSLSSLSKSSRRSSGSRTWRPSRRKTKSERNEEVVTALIDMGDAERDGGFEERAYACWQQALKLSRDSSTPDIRDLHQCVLWKLAMYHVCEQCRESRNEQEDELHHRNEAIAYLVQMDFESCPSEWLLELACKDKEASLLLSLFMENMQWNVALRLAESMSEEAVSPQTLERIRFQVAHQSGSVELLEACSFEDKQLQRQALLALSRAYAQRGDWDQALETNSKLDSTTPLDKAEIFAQKAEFCLGFGSADLAWEALGEGFDVAGEHEESRLLLLQTKAQLLYKSGNLSESLDAHQELLAKWRAFKGPVCPEVAKTHYTMGRIWCRTKNPNKAIECFRQELHVTQVALGKNHSEVARILHEIARLYDEQLGDYDSALGFYQKALAVEQFLLEECRAAKTSATLQQRYREHLVQIRETQKCMGRIHYKMGDFTMAVQTSFDGDFSSPLKNKIRTLSN